jgi:hypothetical protein
MSLFGPPKPKPVSFKMAAEKTRQAIEAAEATASTCEEWTNIASSWQALCTELNPANVMDGKKDD